MAMVSELGPRECPAFAQGEVLTYILDHAALHRWLEFKEDYVYERHVCCSVKRVRGSLYG